MIPDGVPELHVPPPKFEDEIPVQPPDPINTEPELNGGTQAPYMNPERLKRMQN